MLPLKTNFPAGRGVRKNKSTWSCNISNTVSKENITISSSCRLYYCFCLTFDDPGSKFDKNNLNFAT